MGIRFHWSSSSSSSLCSSFAGAAAANKRTRELFILVTGKQEEVMIQCRESAGTEGVVEVPYPMCVSLEMRTKDSPGIQKTLHGGGY